MDIQSDPLSCLDADTDVTITIEGGTGPYRFERISPAVATADSVTGNTGTFLNLAPGEYTFLVTDSNGCPLQRDYTVLPAEGIGIETQELNPVSCFGESSGGITLSLQNTSATYSYTLTGPQTNLNATGAGDLLQFSGLSEGDYLLTVREEGTGCSGDLNFSIDAPPAPLTLNIPSLPVCPEEDGILVQAAGGWGDFGFSLRFPDRTTTVSSPDGFFDGLDQNGEYQVSVTDGLGCNQSVTFTLNTVIDVTISPVYSCTAQGPENQLSFEFPPGSPSSDWLYALDSRDPADYISNPDFSDLEPGTHYVSILNRDGCEKSIPFDIDETEPFEIRVVREDLNRISIETLGGNPPFTYLYNRIDYGDQSEFEATEDGAVEIVVTDQNGCTAAARINLLACDDATPDYFTPDGDAVDDVWIPGCLNRVPGSQTFIYDRFGRKLYTMRPGSAPWDGSYGGTELPSGDYWYVIRFTVGEQAREITGHVTLLR